jgi:predicted aminopeptidase
MPAYLGQAIHGQLDLMRRARPIEDVIDDPTAPIEVRLLLAEISGIKAFGADAGLNTKRNYRTYADVPEGAAVWFVGASKPLAFEAPRWCFPIAGCFTGLGWFERDDAIAHRERLKRDGWDAMARPAGAYSTGGWFPDPVVSSMLDADVAPYAELANVLLHESVHATIFIPDQPYFNEGLAEAIGDALTVEWLRDRFGPDSQEEHAWLEVQAWRRDRVARELVTFKALDALYNSDQPKAAKLKAKAEPRGAARRPGHVAAAQQRPPDRAAGVPVELRRVRRGGGGVRQRAGDDRRRQGHPPARLRQGARRRAGAGAGQDHRPVPRR